MSNNGLDQVPVEKQSPHQVSEIKKSGSETKSKGNESSFDKVLEDIEDETLKNKSGYSRGLETLKMVNQELDEMLLATNSGIYQQFKKRNQYSQVKTNSAQQLYSQRTTINDKYQQKPLEANHQTGASQQASLRNHLQKGVQARPSVSSASNEVPTHKPPRNGQRIVMKNERTQTPKKAIPQVQYNRNKGAQGSGDIPRLEIPRAQPSQHSKLQNYHTNQNSINRPPLLPPQSRFSNQSVSHLQKVRSQLLQSLNQNPQPYNPIMYTPSFYQSQMNIAQKPLSLTYQDLYRNKSSQISHIQEYLHRSRCQTQFTPVQTYQSQYSQNFKNPSSIYQQSQLMPILQSHQQSISTEYMHNQHQRKHQQRGVYQSSSEQSQRHRFSGNLQQAIDTVLQ